MYYQTASEDDDEFDKSTRGGGAGSVWLSRGDGSGQRAIVDVSFSPSKSLTGMATAHMELFPGDAQPLYDERSVDGGVKLEYQFPMQPVPLSVIGNQFSDLDRYSRIRIYPHQSGLKIFEIFDSNSTRPRQRQWRALDLNRQEMFDAKGKLTRLIHYGAVPSKAYEEELKRYAQIGVLKVTPTTTGYASYRVYDYDTAGKERLTFVCWQHDVPSNKPLRHFPWWTPDPTPKRSREETLIYGMKNVANRCGTPDGKMVVQGLAAIDSYMAKTYGYDVEKLSYGEAR